MVFPTPPASLLLAIVIALATMMTAESAWSFPSPSCPTELRSLTDSISPPPAAQILSRRNAVERATLSVTLAVLGGTPAACATVGPVPADSETATAVPIDSTVRKNYRYSSDWTGTALTLLTPEEAAASVSSSSSSSRTFPMGRWPDPLLRRPAAPVPSDLYGGPTLHVVADALRRTARVEGAVGLAAQQCGVDARIVWLDDADSSFGGPAAGTAVALSRLLGAGGRADAVLGEGGSGTAGNEDGQGAGGSGGIFLVNPRIVRRSPEVDMRVWTERCLVLPPTFTATVLRDAEIEVEYDTLSGQTRRVNLGGELARAAQHEMDHDRGILITDHVGLDEMEGGATAVMARMEGVGHVGRMARAYARAVEEPTTIGPAETKVFTDGRGRFRFGGDTIPRANAAEGPDFAPVCDDECLAERRRRIEDRRAMMRQSRSSTSRQDVFELSRQRAALYNTTYQGTSCPPGIPCL